MSVERWLSTLERYLAPVPVPPGFTSREIVRRAIEFEGPPRLPYSFIQPNQSDFVELVVTAVANGDVRMATIPAGQMAFDRWGIGWRSSGRQWGHAEVHPLADLAALDDYRIPDPLPPAQRELARALAKAGKAVGKYVVGADTIGTIERLRGLMGFEPLMVALYEDRERFERLLDLLTDRTVELVESYAAMGDVHGFMTWEDWGLQSRLQIRPAQWREIFKPRYARIVEAAHAAGLHYLWHCCGWLLEIIPDMVEIGVDVLQLDQPRLMGVERLAADFGGKLCFWNTVDIQWSVREDVSLAALRAETRRMIDAFASLRGGFIARQYPQPGDIEMPAEKHKVIYEAFMEYGCG